MTGYSYIFRTCTFELPVKCNWNYKGLDICQHCEGVPKTDTLLVNTVLHLVDEQFGENLI